jgi:hypothetical protein
VTEHGTDSPVTRRELSLELRATFAEFETRMRTHLDDAMLRKADLAMLTDVRKEAQDHGDRLDKLERWQAYVAGAAAVAVALAGVAAAFAGLFT